MELKLPSLNLGPKPKLWDLAAFALLGLSLLGAGASWFVAADRAPGAGLPDSTMLAFVLYQSAIACGSLLILGKTAAEGTLWGNLAAVGGMFAGMSGVLLAAALWVAA